MKASSPFALFLERSNLCRISGAAYFERGEDYFVNGQVSAITEEKGTITAKVRGTYSYRVKLWIEKQGLEYSCSCPVGAEREFCKHCVAVGLAWVESRKQKTSEERQPGAAVSMDDVRAHLLGQDKHALVEMLVDRAMEDDRLRQRLLIKAAEKSSRGSTSRPISGPSMTPWNRTDSWTTGAPTTMPMGSKKRSIPWRNF